VSSCNIAETPERRKKEREREGKDRRGRRWGGEEREVAAS